MKKLILFFVIVIIVLVMNNEIKDEKVCINNECFEIELASNDLERSKGLMFRETLDGGMLFIYENEGRRDFWMKNTLISLDMIWISKDKKIIYIEENVQPCKTSDCESYGPSEKAMYILELNGGEVNKKNIKVGDKVIF